MLNDTRDRAVPVFFRMNSIATCDVAAVVFSHSCIATLTAAPDMACSRVNLAVLEQGNEGMIVPVPLQCYTLKQL